MSYWLTRSLTSALVALVLSFSAYVHAVGLSSRMTVKFGIDNLVDLNFNPLKGKKIALLANVASRTRSLQETVQVLAATPELQLCALLTPEHGYFAQVPAGEHVGGEIIYGIPTFSLYGKTRRPSKVMIGQCDAVVIDLQDIGLRPYTFISTMYNVMDACAEFGIPVYILDRPNPLGGLCVDGNLVENDSRSFVGIVPIPYIHGMTIGELALMINEEGWLPKDEQGSPRKCHLTVVKMKRWRRAMQWESVSSTWIPTSPNIPSINAIRGMALTGLLGELNVFSIGIGTGLPFQYIGQPRASLEGFDSTFKTLQNFNIRSVPSKFVPVSGKFAGQTCNGVMFDFDQHAETPLFSAAVELMIRMRHEYSDYFLDSLSSSPKQQMFNKVAGTKELFAKLTSSTASDDDIRQIARHGKEDFDVKRSKYLLYD